MRCRTRKRKEKIVSTHCSGCGMKAPLYLRDRMMRAIDLNTTVSSAQQLNTQLSSLFAAPALGRGLTFRPFSRAPSHPELWKCYYLTVRSGTLQTRRATGSEQKARKWKLAGSLSTDAKPSKPRSAMPPEGSSDSNRSSRQGRNGFVVKETAQPTRMKRNFKFSVLPLLLRPLP